jgi:hypothetical protein
MLKFIDPIRGFANKGIMEYSKSLTNTFLAQCVIRLGLIYCALAGFVFLFLEYKMSSGFWWMNGIVFALSDAKASALCLSILVAFFVGLFYWIGSYKNFVFQSELTSITRFYNVCYLSLAPLAAAVLTSEVYQYFLYHPLAGYQP